MAAECLVLSAVAVAFVTHRLSGRALGVVGLLNMAAFYVAFLVLFRRAREKTEAEVQRLGSVDAAEAQSQRLRRGIQANKRLMILFACFLMYGEWVNWNSSPWFRVSAAVFDLTVIAFFYGSMRRAKAKLEVLGERK